MKPLKITYITTLSDLQKALRELSLEKVVGFDCETTKAIGIEDIDGKAALDPYRNRIRLIQFATETEAFVIDNFKINDVGRGLIKEFLESEYPIKVGYNLKFDVKQTRHHLGVQHFGRLFCCELAYRLTKCGQEPAHKTLLYVVKEILGIDISKEQQKSDWSVDSLSEEQIYYAGKDAWIVLGLREALIEQIQELKIGKAALIDFNTIDSIAQMELNGFPMDKKRWIKVDTQMRQRRLEVMEELVEKFRNNGAVPQMGLFPGAPIGSSKNSTALSSPKQIAEFLEASGIELPVVKDRHTQKEAKTTSSFWLAPLEKKHEVIPLLLEFRELDKRKSSYGAEYPEKHCHPITGRIHADFDAQGTKTARFSCNKPNLQNIPHIDEYRSCFRPKKGYRFVVADYSQIELRIAGELSSEIKYIEAFKSGKDFHDATTVLIFGLPEPPFPNGTKEYKKWCAETPEGREFTEKRRIAKNINFGILYGIGPGKLAAQANIYANRDQMIDQLTDEGIAWNEVVNIADKTQTASDYLDMYYKSFPDLMKWLDEQGKTTAKYAQSRMMTGRLVKFWIDRDQKWSVSQAERNGKNTPIQGLAGEILKIALKLLHDRVYEAGYMREIKLVNCIHDEIVLECKEELTELAKTLLETAMKDAGEQFLKQVPVKVEGKISDCWSK